MKLSDFIRAEIESILDEWDSFAKDIPAARRMNPEALRDHARGMLLVIATDLDQAQSPQEQTDKSQGRGPQDDQVTKAELHGAARVLEGFSINESLSEFRALRASVLRLWAESGRQPSSEIDEQLVRFNEAIDQALSESVARYSSDKEKMTRVFDTLLSAMPDLNFILDPDGNFIYANKAVADVYGMELCDIANRNVAEVGGPIAKIPSNLRQVLESKEALRAEMPHKIPGGAELTYEYLLEPVMDDAGHVEAVAGMVRDITEPKAYEEDIKRSQNFDALTGLPNRSLFLDRLEQEVKRSERNAMPLATLFIDLDGFKVINDDFGHDAGDQLLQQAARRIGDCVRATDSVARIGGDEFMVLLPEISEINHVEIVAQNILEELARPFVFRGHEMSISGSIGIALFPMDAITPARMMGNADKAMYVAKRAGRNRFSFYGADMREAAWSRLKGMKELRHALVEEQLRVYYQPVVDLAHGTIVKAEALLRWQHPQQGLVQSAEFIGLAEEAGLIDDIDGWVLGEAVARAREWSTLRRDAFQISVNASPEEFLGMEPMRSWDGYFERFESARHCISMEVPEAVLLNASPIVVDKLKALQKAGVQLAIDGFGTGVSSISCLTEFDVDYLKIDRTLVQDSAASPDRRAIAEAAIVMAHMLGLKVIADGVESAAQADWLKSAGCDYAQGYYFSHPVSSGDFANLLGGGGPQ